MEKYCHSPKTQQRKHLSNRCALSLINSVIKICLVSLLIIAAGTTRLMALKPGTTSFVVTACGETWHQRVDSGTSVGTLGITSPQGKAYILFSAWTQGCASEGGCDSLPVQSVVETVDPWFLEYYLDPTAYCANPENNKNGVCMCGEVSCSSDNGYSNPYEPDTALIVGYACNSCPAQTLNGDSLPKGVSPKSLFIRGTYCDENYCAMQTSACPSGYSVKEGEDLPRKYTCSDSGWRLQTDNCQPSPTKCPAAQIDGVALSDKAIIGTEKRVKCRSPKKGEAVFVCQKVSDGAKWTQTEFCKDCLSGEQKFKDCGDSLCEYETYTCNAQGKWVAPSVGCPHTSIDQGDGMGGV